MTKHSALALGLLAATWFAHSLGCGDDDSGGTAGSGAAAGTGGSSAAGSGTGGSAGTAGSGTGATNCQKRCEAAATKCGQPSTQCPSMCASLTEAQLTCVEKAGCDIGTAAKCLEGGGNGGSAGSGGTGTGGSGQCLSLGKTGCDSSQPPTGTPCCDPAVCFADTKGTKACCLEAGKPCTDNTDCCGYGDAPTLYFCNNKVCNKL